MLTVLRQSWALLLGVMLLMIGNGVQGTLLGIRGAFEGFSTQEMSYVMSAYFLGFLADAVLRLAIDRSSGGGPATASIQADSDAGGGELAQRSAEAMAPAGLPVDPTWLVLGVLLVVGIVIVVVSRRRRRHRSPGQIAV